MASAVTGLLDVLARQDHESASAYFENIHPGDNSKKTVQLARSLQMIRLQTGRNGGDLSVHARPDEVRI